MNSQKHIPGSASSFNPQDTQTSGTDGQVVLQDYALQENLAQAVRQRTPERIVNAKGSGAYGKFTVTHDITKFTSAKLFSKVGKECKVFARFSTMGSEKGSADTERDVRGFALKFYTEEGNWDIVGNNTPVFFIKDAKKFPEFIQSQKKNPKTNLKQTTLLWDFYSLNPESLHQLLILMSDRGTPRGYRHMHGFGAHTYSMINAANEKVWVKFHFKTKQGINNFSESEAIKVKGENPDFAQEDLMNAIESAEFPKWALYVQIMTEEQAKDFRWNPFDVTIVWLKDEFPLIEVGELELNEIPANFFTHVEQSTFSPGNLINGIGLSPDKLLHARLFSYPDAHRYRVGLHADQLDVNRCLANTDLPRNSLVTGSGAFRTSNIERDRMPHFIRPENEDDHYTQPGLLYTKAMTQQDRENLVENIVKSMQGITGPKKDEIINRQLCHFFRANIELGMKIAMGLKVNIDSNMMSHFR